MLHTVKIFVIIIVIGVDTVETLTGGRNYSRSCLRKSAQGTVRPNKKRLRASGQFIGYGTHVGRQFKREGIWAGRHSTQHNRKEGSKRMEIRRWRTTKWEDHDSK